MCASNWFSLIYSQCELSQSKRMEILRANKEDLMTTREELVIPAGVEPKTFGFGGQGTNALRYHGRERPKNPRLMS